MKNNLFSAIAILTGTTIGAGFLGLPYVISKSGFLIGAVYIIAIGLIVMFTNLCLGEVSLRTKGNHQLTGYSEKYLGKYGKIAMFFSTIFGIYSALLAYLIVEGESISQLIFKTTEFSFHLGLLFWLLMTALLYLGFSSLKKFEKFGLLIKISLVVLIFIISSQKINLQNVSYINSNFMFLPFGVVLFSFLAFSAMPELELMLKKQEYRMKKAIIISSVISILVYLAFTFSVVSSLGKNTPEISTLALGNIFIILGIIAIFTAYLVLSFAIKNMFFLDFKLSEKNSLFIASIIPLVLFIATKAFNLASFTQILGISGTVSGGLTGILAILMNRKAKKLGNRKPEYKIKLSQLIIILLSLFFLAGVLIEIGVF